MVNKTYKVGDTVSCITNNGIYSAEIIDIETDTIIRYLLIKLMFREFEAYLNGIRLVYVKYTSNGETTYTWIQQKDIINEN